MSMIHKIIKNTNQNLTWNIAKKIKKASTIKATM